MSLVSELKRRNVFRMAVLYVLAAWLIMQIAEVVIGLAALPTWVGQATLVLLTVGFPIALIFSWFYEITPEGLALEKDVPRHESITYVTGRRIDFIVIALLCAAVLILAVDKWWTGGPLSESIAVLAFENMSADPEQEYFSDGISEEILDQLAKVQELRVISRSSAFSYKGRDINLSDVARELNVAHILEGSVRKDGHRVRITAQLIDARSDTHLWSETYDRTLDDIFAVQNEIAVSVVDKLKIAILGELKQVEKTDPEAYTLYLHGRHLMSLSTEVSLRKALATLKESLAIDPGYSPAWLSLGKTYDRLSTFRAMPTEEADPLSLAAIKRSLELSPDSGRAHDALAWRYFNYIGDLETAATHFERAMELEPTNTNIVGNVSIFLSAIGRSERAIEFGEFQVSRDPANTVAINNLAIRYRWAGRFDETERAFQTVLTLTPGFVGANYELGAALLAKNEYLAAELAFKRESVEVFGQIGMAMASYALEDVDRSNHLVAELVHKYGDRIAFYVAQIEAFRGEKDVAFEWLEKAKLSNARELVTLINEPLFTNLHTDPRWGAFLESIGKSPEQLAAIEFEVMLPN
jgi:TolB-like protein/Tfp pilus assembly protein PilF